MSAYSTAALIAFLNAEYGGQDLFVSPYEYELFIGDDIALGASVSKTLQITSNQDFLLTAIYAIDIEDSQSGSSILIVDNTSGDPFSYGPVPLPVIAAMPASSTSGMPMFGQLPYPRLLEGRTSLNVQFTASPNFPLTDSLFVVLSGMNVRAA